MLLLITRDAAYSRIRDRRMCQPAASRSTEAQTPSKRLQRKYTMTITSFTDTNKSYETTPETCSCPAKRWNPNKQCKHQTALIHELNRATIFGLLFIRFDCRANGDEVTHRCNFELSIGA